MSDSDAAQLAEFGYKQELHRTLGSFSSFAAGFSYISILTGMFQTSYLGFLFAGPAFIWAWIFVLFGQMMVALQFAELSAHYPLAGSVYQWSKQVAGKDWAWNTGWMYLCAQIVTVPAVALGWQVILPQISHRFVFVGTYQDNLDYTNANFAKNAIILGIIMIGLTTLINMAGVSVMSRINNVGVAAELIGAAGLIIIFLINAQRSPSEVLTNTAGTGAGHSWGYLGALLIGAIMPLYVMYGFDTAGSLAEETDDPQRRAPRAVLQALATAGTMGFLLILFGTMAVSDKGYANITSIGGLAGITTDVLGSTWGKVFLVDVAVAIFVCCLAIHAMSVRILFAMGRDNNLPGGAKLASVSGTRRVPVFPAILVGVISVAILAFNWLNPYAFTIVISCGIVFMYLAYLGVTVPLFQRRRVDNWPANLPTANRGLFRLGGAALLTNGIAVLYGAAMTVNLAWPREEFYGTKWYQHYGVITAIVVVVGAGLILYYGYQRTRMEVLPEHRADQMESLSAAMHEPPPIHGGP
ncbi:MAG TPA: APC family permease [Gaiellales bacterium]|nr:APC family permease [Gaiellales bacterium]